jgi:hypothetical protein
MARYLPYPTCSDTRTYSLLGSGVSSPASRLMKARRAPRAAEGVVALNQGMATRADLNCILYPAWFAG